MSPFNLVLPNLVSYQIIVLYQRVFGGNDIFVFASYILESIGAQVLLIIRRQKAFSLINYIILNIASNS